MKILIASSPFTGHINPMFSIARMLVSEGHQVAGLSSSAMRGPIEGAGATFYPFPKVIDRDYRDMVHVFPEYNNIAPGLEMSRFYLERVTVEPHCCSGRRAEPRTERVLGGRDPCRQSLFRFVSNVTGAAHGSAADYSLWHDVPALSPLRRRCPEFRGLAAGAERS